MGRDQRDLGVPVSVTQRELCPAEDKKNVFLALVQALCVHPEMAVLGMWGHFGGVLDILRGLDPSLGMGQPIFPPSGNP